MHARRCAPAESCGFVIGTPEGERYQPCVNISAEPEACYTNDLAPEDGCRQRCRGRLWHWSSHPDEYAPRLSEADRRLQIKKCTVRWLVCRGKFINSLWYT
ncbi:Mov34/MPN/PAD-1 family protein [Escherichia coli]|nr:Mov34/MPN/PAD-1 family protein [Escherichia coli]